MNDFPLVRAHRTCVGCWLDHKSAGLLLCWECNARQKNQYNGAYGPTVMERLAELQTRLEGAQ